LAANFTNSVDIKKCQKLSLLNFGAINVGEIDPGSIDFVTTGG